MSGWKNIVSAQLPISSKSEKVGALLLDGNVYAPIDVVVQGNTATIRHRKSGITTLGGDNYIHGQVVFAISD